CPAITQTLATRLAATLPPHTIHTIRHWARYGANRATQKAGRWHIERTSLLRRIERDPRTRKERKRTVELTVENLVAVGGREWKRGRSEEHTSELQSRENLVCRLLLDQKN